MEELIKALKTIKDECAKHQSCNKDCPLRDVADCRVSFAKAIVEHHEKYGWHDLRKNPNDLPEDDAKEYECVEQWNDATKTHDVVYGNYIKGHAVTTTRDVIAVIAWREIEPFESEVE